MWHIRNPELRPATLDFTSSDQGHREVTQLFADKVQIFNALELIDWDEEETQFLICEDCGFDHCKPGGWVRVRRSDSRIVILPSFNYVSSEWAEDRNEYSPPRYLKERGIVCIDQSTYEGLRAQHASFPAFEQIRQLNEREGALLSDWDADAQS